MLQSKGFPGFSEGLQRFFVLLIFSPVFVPDHFQMNDILVVCLLSYLTLIYESFKDKKGTKLNGWTAVGSIHKSKEPLLICILGDFVTGSLWQKIHLFPFLLQNP